MSSRLKIFFLAIVPLLVSLALIAYAVRDQQQRLSRSEQALVREEYMSARQAELRNYVQLAVSTIRPLYDAAPGEDRRAEALRLLGSLDYGNDGYFFVYDLQGHTLMHSREPELVGKNLWELRDPQGRPTIQQLIARANEGGGFIEYIWHKPSSGQPAKKLGYVVALPRWGWMIGTGLYLDDIDTTLQQLETQVGGNVAGTMAWIGGIAVVALAVISACGLLLKFSEQRVADARLRLLGRRVGQLQEEERAHLARELHDGAGQTLVSAKLMIESAVEGLGSGDAASRHDLGRALDCIKRTLQEIRRIAHRLRPALLDTLGLPAALQHLGSEFDADGRIAVDINLLGAERELPDEVKTVLFRVAQEALTNIGKHAGATHVVLTLEFHAAGGVDLHITDNGQGFDTEAAALQAEGIGLRNMRERVSAIGGRMQLASRPGIGTEIDVHLPMQVLQQQYAATMEA
jgi:two-component system NarL family sensor kinase